MMDVRNRRWVKLYTEEIGSFAQLPLFARALAAELLKLCDDRGYIGCGRRTPVEAIAFALGADKQDRALLRKYLPLLLADGFLAEVDGGLVVKNFAAAQRKNPVAHDADEAKSPASPTNRPGTGGLSLENGGEVARKSDESSGNRRTCEVQVRETPQVTNAERERERSECVSEWEVPTDGSERTQAHARTHAPKVDVPVGGNLRRNRAGEIESVGTVLPSMELEGADDLLSALVETADGRIYLGSAQMRAAFVRAVREYGFTAADLRLLGRYAAEGLLPWRDRRTVDLSVFLAGKVPGSNLSEFVLKARERYTRAAPVVSLRRETPLERARREMAEAQAQAAAYGAGRG